MSRYKLEKEKIINDLTKERPLYILSAYGPEKEIPIQLFGGYPREQSFEELRLRHYELAFQGNQQQAIQEAQSWYNDAEQQIRTALSDVEGAIKYMIGGEKDHPNRIDICRGKIAASNGNHGTGAFQQAGAAFGQPSSISGFGKPSPLAPQHSAFMQQQSVSAFGQPAQLGRPTNNFGQSTTQAPSFGQPSKPLSAFGQPTTAAPAFGQPSAPLPTFGQPSASSAINQGSSLGQQAAPAFGTPSVLGSKQQPTSAFAQAGNPFGQPSIASQSPAFGGPGTDTGNALGQQPAQPNGNVFGQPGLAATNPFAKAAGGLFGQPGIASSIEPQKKPFGQPTGPQPGVQSQQAHAKFAGGRLTTWKGMHVDYVDDVPCIKSPDGGYEKVLFPNGPPPLTKSAELPDEDYDEGTKENYRFMRTKGVFKDGIMPNLPPKRIWCKWDF